MENTNKKIFKKIEWVVIITASLVCLLGLVAMIIGILGCLEIIKSSTPNLWWAILAFGIAWFVTSPWLIVGIVFDWSKKTMQIFSIISICCINAAGLSTLLLASKKKDKPVVTETPMSYSNKPEEPKVVA